MKFNFLVFFFKSVEKIQVLLKVAIIIDTLHEDQFTFLIISRSGLLRTRNVSDKSCREHQQTYYVFSNFFFESLALYETMWKKFVGSDRT